MPTINKLGMLVVEFPNVSQLKKCDLKNNWPLKRLIPKQPFQTRLWHQRDCRKNNGLQIGSFVSCHPQNRHDEIFSNVGFASSRAP